MRPSWMPSIGDILFILILELLFVCLPNFIFGDGSTGWHLVTGHYILDQHQIPRTDLISYTFPDKAWVAYEWLFDAFIAMLDKIAGLRLVAVGCCSAIAFLFMLLYQDCRKRGCHYLLALTLCTMGALVSAIHWLARPHLVTFFGVYIFTRFLREYSQSEISKKKLLLILGSTMLVWVNCHPAFLMGLVIISIHLVSDLAIAFCISDSETKQNCLSRAKTYALALSISLLATFINPYGIQLYLYIVSYLHQSVVLAANDEFSSPVFHGQLQSVLLELLYFALVFGLAVSKKKPGLATLLTVLAYAHLSLSARRNMPLFVIVSLPLIAEMLGNARLTFFAEFSRAMNPFRGVSPSAAASSSAAAAAVSSSSSSSSSLVAGERTETNPEQSQPATDWSAAALDHSTPSLDLRASVQQPSLSGTDPSLPGTDPRLPAADPSLPGTDPRLPAADPGLLAADPGLPGTESRSAAADPGLPGTDPSSTVAEPGLPAPDPSLPVADPSLPVADPNLAAAHLILANGSHSESVSISPASWLNPIVKLWNSTSETINAMEFKCTRHALPIAAVSFLALSCFKDGKIFGVELVRSQFDSMSKPTRTLSCLVEDRLDYNRGFTYDNWGGYLRYKSRHMRVFIDDRSDFYGEKFYLDYRDAATVQPNWQQILDKYKIQWVLFPRNSVLVARLKEDPNWTVLCVDDASELIVKKSEMRGRPVLKFQPHLLPRKNPAINDSAVNE